MPRPRASSLEPLQLPRALLLATALACSRAAELRGVPASEWAGYFAGGDVFACSDGQGQVPISQLNDDYCDCADGSDEPGAA